jgi:hypothetical protein
LAGCGKPATSVGIESPAPAAKAAEFKKGQGLLLTPEAVEFIGLRKAEAQAKADRVVLPRQALLRTSEGMFVFVANGQRWLRTPVKVGAESAEIAEIADGVLEGDLVVVAGVWDLWMAELQAIKGGVGCADGH